MSRASSYETRGITFPLTTTLGRQVMPANLIVRDFDDTFATPRQQLDYVAFLDGREKAACAVEESCTTFRESWKRPKWHIFTQD